MSSADSFFFVRVLGNIGQPWLSIFSSVRNPMLAAMEESNWRVANHHPFNGKRESTFGSTSMHLSFTSWGRAIDQSKE
ncbi:hypothetical protein GGR57DRAFT_476853 [Xylariaceae sp. FL1272]|nr:hypothetical protein GGR57DRAFT_476853 [Xylariaceae sp. FL1272]